MAYQKESKTSSFSGCINFFLFLFLMAFIIYNKDDQSSKTTMNKRSVSKVSSQSRKIQKTSDTALVDDLYSLIQYKERKSGRNLLHLACLYNKPLLAEKLLEKEFDVNKTDRRSNTPINLALYNNSRETVEVLLKASPVLTIANRDGLLPMHSAARYGYYNIVKQSLRAGVNIDSRAPGRYTALHFAGMNGHLDIVVLLVENGAATAAAMQYGWTPGDLCFKKHKDIALYLQSKNAPFNKGQLIWEFDLASGWPLPHLDEIKNQKSSREPELFAATLANDSQRLKALADAGKDFDLLSDAKTPLLCFALLNQKLEAAQAILPFCKKMNQTDMAGRSALIIAVENGNKDFAIKLLEKGVDANIKDLTGHTALLYAVKNWENDLVLALIKSGAEVFAQNRLEQGPLHFAVKNYNLQIFEFLIKNGCDVNLENIHGNTPLHLAASNGNAEIVNRLLKHGADPTHRNLKGQLPLDLVPATNRHLLELLQNRVEIEGTNPIERAPAEIDLSLPEVKKPLAEAGY
jgi:ankyrin repeat protein